MRGIVFTYDAIIALTIFAFIALLYLSALTQIATPANNIEGVAERVATNLFESYGIPPNWHVAYFSSYPNFDAVLAIGLAKRFGEIDGNKLNAFYNMSATNYDETRLKLGVGKYNFYLEVDPWKIGNAPTNAKNVVVITRKILVNGDVKEAKLYVWE